MAMGIIKLLLLLTLLFTYHKPSTSQSIRSLFDDLRGRWTLLHSSVGISAMHMQLLRNNKVVMFDRTDFGPSNISLRGGRCRYDPLDMALQEDCTAHSILYDIATNTYRPLMVQTDTWCSSGSLLPDGTFVQTGGFNDGDHAVRKLMPCEDYSCDWIEFPNALSQRRWYATNQLLPDGRVIIVGGRRQSNYEFYPNTSPPQHFFLGFLRDTRDGTDENNLYPFIHLLPDGNLFIFANTRSILFDYNRNNVVKEFPEIPGGDPRNYPSSGSSILLPLDENCQGNLTVEVLICGGAPRAGFAGAKVGSPLQASSTCGRLVLSDETPSWTMEDMPTPRVMGDMVLLPTGNILIINGAQTGTSGWDLAREPMTRPVFYYPYAPPGWRFAVMVPSPRPRMYHSSAVLLPDGRVLVGGSNPHFYYNFTNVEFPTDLSLEAFSPPYLSMEYSSTRPRIISFNQNMRYGLEFSFSFMVDEFLGLDSVSVRIVAPTFTTHSFSMNQRMVGLKLIRIEYGLLFGYGLTCVGPSGPRVAPSGYYMLFLVHNGVPSSGIWVKLQ